MLSARQIKRQRSKSQILTTGGINEYYIESADFQKLVNLFNKASNKKVTASFLNSLFTKRELVDATRRILIAKMLLSNTSYEDIQNQIHTCKNTISLIKKNLYNKDDTLRNLIIDTYGLSATELYLKRRLQKGK